MSHTTSSLGSTCSFFLIYLHWKSIQMTKVKKKIIKKSHAEDFWLTIFMLEFSTVLYLDLKLCRASPGDKWADITQTPSAECSALESDKARTNLASEAMQVNKLTNQILIHYTQPITPRAKKLHSWIKKKKRGGERLLKNYIPILSWFTWSCAIISSSFLWPLKEDELLLQ